MRTKRKMSLTIDEEVYEAIERASEAQNMARSQIAEDALRLWLQKQTEALMAKGYEEMADEDEKMASAAFEAQREILK
jgi:metal-responsive CopG/Arc/MetJ family transcriptional regulator